MGVVSAGRDTGDLTFERAHVVEHVRFLAAALRIRPDDGVELRVTVGEPRFTQVVAAVRAALPDVDVVDDPDRAAGTGYYAGFCYKASTVRDGVRKEIADGGVLDWTQRLLGNRKERLVTSGLGIDDLATL
jgi:histidyl-tRNA synthetase